MSESVHFARLKCFSEEFTKDSKYEDVLGALKKILEEEQNSDELIDSKFIENINTQYLVLNLSKNIKNFLESGSKIQLHPKSMYYFVNQEIWKFIEEDISTEFQQIKNKEDVLKLAEDYVVIKDYFNKKMLVFDAS